MNSDSLKIRPFMKRDMKAILEILQSLGWALQYIEGQEKSLEKLSQEEEGEILVSTDGSVIFGFIQVQHYRWNRLSYIHGLAVSPDMRRKGVARMLVCYAEQTAQKRGNRGILVDTPVDNTGGRLFYEAQGYSAAYRMPHYYEERLDGIAYLKFFQRPVLSTPASKSQRSIINVVRPAKRADIPDHRQQRQL